MAQDLTDRQARIVELLGKSSAPVPVFEIARQLESSERTVQRDVDSIRASGVSITSSPGRRGGLVLAQRLNASRSGDRARTGTIRSRPSKIAFVGRSAENSELDRLLADMLDGSGSTIVILGEPGIGKTRIVQELEARSLESGILTIWGRCRDIEGTPPFWPWIQALRSLSEIEISRLGRELPEETIRIIASAVPEFERLAPGVEGSGPSASSTFELFEVFTQTMRSVSDRRPLVLILDDLHWADQASLGLLEYLAAEISRSRILLVGTGRTIDPVPSGNFGATLTKLVRLPGFSRMELGGLTREQVHALIDQGTASRVGRDFVGRVFDAAEGNPFFTLEMSRLYLDEQSRTKDIGPPAPALPDAVLGVIERRLEGLSEDCIDVLRIGAILGYRFEFARLNRIARAHASGDPIDLMDEALNARVVDEVAGNGLTYEFGHALIHRFLYDTMPAGQRIRLHGSVAGELEGALEGGSPISAEELAFHYAQAKDLLGPEKAIVYSQRAANDALAVFAANQAIKNFERAISLKQVAPVDRDLGDLYFGLGQALNVGDAPFEAVDMMIKAMDVFEELCETERMIEVASLGIVRGRGDAPRQTEICERGLAVVDPKSPTAGIILNEYGMALGANEEIDRALQTFDKAIEIARSEEDLFLEAHTLANVATTLMWDRQQSRVPEIVDRVLAIAASIEAPVHLVPLAHRCATVSFLEMGELDEARRHAGALVKHHRESRAPQKNTADLDYGYASLVELLSGNWTEAMKLHDELLTINPAPIEYGTPAHVEFMSGDPLAAIELLKSSCQTAEQAFIVALAAVNLAGAGLMVGDPEVVNFAAMAARTVRAMVDFTPGIDDMVEGVIACVAIAERDEAAAKRSYDRMKQFRGMNGSFNSLIGIDRSLALISKATGGRKNAEMHFREAIALTRRAGIRPELAWTLHDFAFFEMEKGRSGNPSSAAAMADEALTIAEALSMPFLKSRLEKLRETIELSSRPEFPDGLTRREVDVLQLVAKGRSNREIADELFITANTAAKHVANILGKTGSANRAEAAAYAGSNGLLDSLPTN